VVHEGRRAQLAVVRVKVVPDDLVAQVNGGAAAADRVDHVRREHLRQQQPVDAQAAAQRLAARAEEEGGLGHRLGALAHAHLQ
jgi:hypothetical protein